ncbi:hypothetical protein LUZ60_003667 [Juncus effusus]|nr:hypothetical protein LUZ60_003667 [Juncus effusus]
MIVYSYIHIFPSKFTNTPQTKTLSLNILTFLSRLMGNNLSPCCYPPSGTSTRLVCWGGSAKLIQSRRQAGDLMRESPGHVVCHADSFYIGLPVPVLSICDELLPGQTYFLVPVDRLTYDQALTAASLSTLSPNPNFKSSFVGIGHANPFEHIKNEDGSTLIKVSPEFIERVISNGGNGGGKKNVKCESVDRDNGGVICNTLELKKHYAQMVGPRDHRQWSPRLETISENCKSKTDKRGRLSPVKPKLFGFPMKAR